MRYSLRTLMVVMLLGGPVFVWLLVVLTNRPVLSLPIPFLFASALFCLGSLMAACLLGRVN